MRYVCLIMTALFGLFTYLQFNDLEQYETKLWYFWVLGYGLCALISLASWRRALPRKIYISGVVIALVAALIRFQSIDWAHQIFHNQKNPSGNETGGLLIIALWFGVLALRHESLGSPVKKS